MMNCTTSLAAVCALLGVAALAPAAAAQDVAQAVAEQTPTPTHSVVRFFKCSPQVEGIRILQKFRSTVQDMIAEGKFIDYGILQHSWGDEWNVVDFFLVSGLGAFFANFTEAFQRSRAAYDAALESGDLRPFDEVCKEHKDVIYAVVPPQGGE